MKKIACCILITCSLINGMEKKRNEVTIMIDQQEIKQTWVDEARSNAEKKQQQTCQELLKEQQKSLENLKSKQEIDIQTIIKNNVDIAKQKQEYYEKELKRLQTQDELLAQFIFELLQKKQDMESIPKYSVYSYLEYFKEQNSSNYTTLLNSLLKKDFSEQQLETALMTIKNHYETGIKNEIAKQKRINIKKYCWYSLIIPTCPCWAFPAILFAMTGGMCMSLGFDPCCIKRKQNEGYHRYCDITEPCCGCCCLENNN